jgi:hypothetical protein
VPGERACWVRPKVRLGLRLGARGRGLLAWVVVVPDLDGEVTRLSCCSPETT